MHTDIMTFTRGEAEVGEKGLFSLPASSSPQTTVSYTPSLAVLCFLGWREKTLFHELV